jgi:putative two-component system response regulator
MPSEYILCIDDEAVVLQSLRQEIRNDPFFADIGIEAVDSPHKVLSLIRELRAEGKDIPVILTDQRMPGMTGAEMLLEVQGELDGTKAILLTGFSDLDAVARLVNKNALHRFLTKPWIREDLLLTLREAFLSYRHEKMVKTLTVRIESLSHAMVTALENTNHFFDEETGNHVHRISVLSEAIGKWACLDPDFVHLVKLYSPLHDIGKVGIRKEVLLKPGKLTPEEFEHIKEHSMIGYKIIDDPDIDPIAQNIVLYHHEKWNGNGYLAGLQGEGIPLEARIVSIADVFDALINKRVYKEAMSMDQAISVIREGRGTSFDPDLTDAFIQGMSSINYPVDLYGNT